MQPSWPRPVSLAHSLRASLARVASVFASASFVTSATSPRAVARGRRSRSSLGNTWSCSVGIPMASVTRAVRVAMIALALALRPGARWVAADELAPKVHHLPTAVSLESRLGAILEASASVSQDYGRTSARLRGVLQLVRLQERHEHTAAVREDECSREATASRRESQCGLDDGGAWRPTVRLARTERRRHGSFRGPTVRELLAVLAMARRCPQRSRRTPGS